MRRQDHHGAPVRSGTIIWMKPRAEQRDPEIAMGVPKSACACVLQPNPSTGRWADCRKVLRDIGVEPDVEARNAAAKPSSSAACLNTNCGTREGEAAVAWIHRRKGDREMYFVASQVAAPMTAEMSFRVGDKTPEFWDPETGRITKPAMWTAEKRRTHGYADQFPPFGSKFVVFRSGAGRIPCGP